MSRHATVAIAFAGDLHTFHFRSQTCSVLCGFVAVADEEADQMRVGLHVHVLETDHIEPMVATSEHPTESNDWPASAHVVHTLCRSKHRLVFVFVLRAGVFVEDNFDRSVQMLAGPGVLACVRRGERVLLASEISDVVHVDVLAVSFILRVDASDALADGSPGETRFLLVREEDDDSTHAGAGISRWHVFEAPAHELVGVGISLEALG